MNGKADPEEVKEITAGSSGKISKSSPDMKASSRSHWRCVMALSALPDPMRTILKGNQGAKRFMRSSPPSVRIMRTDRQASGCTRHLHGSCGDGEINLEKGTHGVVGDTITRQQRLSGLARPGRLSWATIPTAGEGIFYFEFLNPHRKSKSGPLRFIDYGTKEIPERSIGSAPDCRQGKGTAMY